MPYKHITTDERDFLQSAFVLQLDTAIIARIIGKHDATIYREAKRNSTKEYYVASGAQLKAVARRYDSKPLPKQGNTVLMQDITRRFLQDHSPEQISGRLKLEYPGQKERQASTELIYQYLYNRISVEPGLKEHFRQGQKKRRKRLSGKDKRGCIPNRKFIDERPAIVEEKVRLGDWEGDTVEGGGKKGYIATFVDRCTKLLIAYPLATKETLGLVKGVKHAFARVPAGAVITLTVDNGKEFAAHSQLGKAIGGDVFFAHPYHSWERGLNEHTNGLLRQYFPKKMPLDMLTKSELDKAVKRINNRPRKSLGYQTPQEVYTQKLFALQT
jgi:transposase, IS30 family